MTLGSPPETYTNKHTHTHTHKQRERETHTQKYTEKGRDRHAQRNNPMWREVRTGKHTVAVDMGGVSSFVLIHLLHWAASTVCLHHDAVPSQAPKPKANQPFSVV